jgi:hypothetical protein
MGSQFVGRPHSHLFENRDSHFERNAVYRARDFNPTRPSLADLGILTLAEHF